jgi:hypothetical protein
MSLLANTVACARLRLNHAMRLAGMVPCDETQGWTGGRSRVGLGMNGVCPWQYCCCSPHRAQRRRSLSVAEPLELVRQRSDTVGVVPRASAGPTAELDAKTELASLPPLWAGVSEIVNVSAAWSAACWPSGVRGAGVWTLSCLNIAATSEADEEAETGRGLKTGAAALRGWRVTKSTMGTGSVMEAVLGFSWESGIGESAMALTGYSYARSWLPSEDIEEDVW